MAAMTDQASPKAALAPATAPSSSAVNERRAWWMVGVSAAIFAVALVLIYTRQVPQAWIPYVRGLSSALALVAALGVRRIGRARLQRKRARG
jgi:glucan phosphoethanolaminetransferase (alkaline phosphatase superfamily)